MYDELKEEARRVFALLPKIAAGNYTMGSLAMCNSQCPSTFLLNAPATSDQWTTSEENKNHHAR